jgi:hypothetical protein
MNIAKRVLVGIGAVAGGAAILATSLAVVGESHASAQVAQSHILLMGPSYPYPQPAISPGGVTLVHNVNQWTVQVQGATGGVNYTCAIIVANLQDATALQARIVGDKTTEVDCRGSYTNARADAKTTFIDSTQSGSFEVKSNP